MSVCHRIFWILGPSLGLALLVGWSTPVAAQAKLLEAPCVRLFQLNNWAQAARCFAAKSQTLPASKKYYRGRLLRNAALLWRKAALAKPKASAAPLFQRAILHFRTYRREVLCLDVALCQQAKTYINKMCLAVGCGMLSITPKPSFALIKVSAVGWSLAKRSQWETKQLPPGRYQILVSAPGLTPRQLNLRVEPKKRHKLTVSLLPPPKRKVPQPAWVPKKAPTQKSSPPVFGWVGLVSGVALLAGGGALLGVGHASFGDFKANVWDNPTAPVTPAEREGAKSRSDAMVISGIVMLGVGGALAVAGGLSLLLHKPTPNTTAQLPKLPQTGTRRAQLYRSP